MKKKKDADLFERAQLGAKEQLNDLVCDAKLLVGLFPPFRDSIDKDGLPVSFILKKGRDQADAKALKQSRWTDARRQAASARMKKYWASRRATGNDQVP